MKKVVILILSIFMLFSSVSTFASKDEGGTVSQKEAITAALFHVTGVKNVEGESKWKNNTIKALQPIPVYDASDELVSYIVNLQSDGQPAGYIEVSGSKDDYPILSFSYESNLFDKNITNELLKKADNTKKIKSFKIVATGPSNFSLKVDYEDGSADILGRETISLTAENNKPKESVKKLLNEESRQFWKKNIEVVSGEIGTTSDGVTDSLAFESGYSGRITFSYPLVSDLNQYTNALWEGPSGCVPTSAYNVMYYWTYAQSKTGLLSTQGQHQSIYELRQKFFTDNNGLSSVSNITEGLRKYALSKGYTASVGQTYNPTWTQVKSDIFDYGPSVLSFVGQTFYNGSQTDVGHTVTGVGYDEFIYNGSSAGHRYMKVYDNTDTTPKDVYVAHGRNYVKLWSDRFKVLYKN